MPLHRYLTARNALIGLLVWLFIALGIHLKAELWNPATARPAVLTPAEPFVDDHKQPNAQEHALNTPKPQEIGGGNNSLGEAHGRRTAVVVASQASENATWLEDNFPQWETNIYRVDNTSAELTVPKNKGRESMVYLTFIIDNYDKLPDNILFIHPNRFQWHNDDPDYDGLPMLRHFQIPYLEKEGYVNIRCAWTMGCPSEIRPFEEAGEHREAVHAGGDYKTVFEKLFPEIETPKYVGVSCCAQFAATKEKVRERKKEDYIRYRDWLMNTHLDDSISGRILEYSWHIIFGMEPVHCPIAEDCYCKVFGQCDLKCVEKGSCTGRYSLPPYSSLPVGWPLIGWKGEERERAGPEE